MNQANNDTESGNYDSAIGTYSAVIENRKNGLSGEGLALIFYGRGVAYGKKGDNDRAIANYTEAIRLDPNNALAFCNRGRAKLKIKDSSGNADIAKARQLDTSVCR